MQFALITLLGLSAFAAAAPVADPAAAAAPDAAPVEDVNAIFARTSSAACCPKGKKSSCSPCPSSGKCPATQPDKYSQCSNLGQIGLVNLLLCNVLNGNTVSVPITVSLLS